MGIRLIAILIAICLSGSLLGCSGCAAKRSGVGSVESVAPLSPTSSNLTEVKSDHMVIWRADLTIEVWNVSNAVSQAVALATQSQGQVEGTSYSSEESASLRIRVPSKSLRDTVGLLEHLGTVIYKNVAAEDVTEQYIDVEARLKNKIVLRDRLKQLLDKTTDVKDILAIETELNRVQGDIDSMEGRIKSLKGQVDLATIDLRLQKKRVLGPLGYLFKGIWWGVKKLFILSD